MQKNIIIPNPTEFEKKKQEFITAGVDNFHIISDFDSTLTKAFIDGKEAHSSFAWIRKQKYLSQEYTKMAYALYHKYYPIEQAHDISEEERNPQMLEWWSRHLELLIKSKMTKDILKQIVDTNKIYLRDGCDEFFSFLKKNNIPMLIFSAGLGDVIKGFLEQKNKISKNIHVISNFFEFDEEGKVIGYNSKIIHTFNKNEYAVKDTPYFKEIEKRKNVLLLGDNLGDLGMSEGLSHNCIIRIGFLNKKVDTLLDQFKDNFDVIILGDGGMEFVNELVGKVE